VCGNFFIFDALGELIKSPPFVDIHERDESTTERWEEKIGIIVVQIKLILLPMQHILKKRDSTGLYGLTPFNNKILKSLAISRK
jgi:hypothetical protein